MVRCTCCKYIPFRHTTKHGLFMLLWLPASVVLSREYNRCTYVSPTRGTTLKALISDSVQTDTNNYIHDMPNDETSLQRDTGLKLNKT